MDGWIGRCNCIPAVALLLLILFPPCTRASPPPVIGANAMDLPMYYHGQTAAMGGSAGEVWTGTQMARRIIGDAKDLGVSYLRVAISGYGPSNVTEIGWGARDDLTPWLTNPTAYWAETDRMFEDLDAAGLQIVPVLMWNPAQFPAMSNSTLPDLLTGTGPGIIMAKSFIQSFLFRYAMRRTILFVELTNEWNLLADVDDYGYCLSGQWGTATTCSPLQNITTFQLASFVKQMADFVHFTVPGMLVSSGFALPRPSAWHSSITPYSVNAQGKASGPDWTSDTPQEQAKNIAYLHQDVDIVSVHIYPGDTNFAGQPGTEAQTAAAVAAIAHGLGKKLYVGEFGDSSVSTYLRQMFGGFAAGGVDYASIWAVDFYQSSTYTFASGFNLDPQYTPLMDEFVAQQLGSSAPAPTEPPRVVLSWPIPCTSFAAGQAIDMYALASGAAGVSDVKFFLDGVMIADAIQPPYHVQLSVPNPELAQLSAVATGNGQSVSSTIEIAAGVPSSSCQPPLLDTGTTQIAAQPISPTVPGVLALAARVTPPINAISLAVNKVRVVAVQTTTTAPALQDSVTATTVVSLSIAKVDRTLSVGLATSTPINVAQAAPPTQLTQRRSAVQLSAAQRADLPQQAAASPKAMTITTVIRRCRNRQHMLRSCCSARPGSASACHDPFAIMAARSFAEEP